MNYDIPQNLTKYAEEFLFGLSLKQFIYAGIFTIGSFLTYTQLEDIITRWIIILILLPIIALGIFFVFFDLEGKIRGQRNLNKSLYKASYFDRTVNSFIDVSEIKDDVVLLKNNTILGMVEVKPIDFFILSSEEKERRLNSYREWLRSIDYYVQVLSRSVSVDMEKWLKNIKKKSPEKERTKKFSNWIKEELGDKRNRIFYLVIPEKPDMERRSFFSEIKSIFTGEYGKEGDTEQLKKNLRNNINNCRETLEKAGLKTRRLKTDEMLGLYSSYFINQNKINKTILSPIMEFDPLLLKEQDRLFEKIKNEAIKQIGYQGN